jgi:hypothetical protein
VAVVRARACSESIVRSLLTAAALFIAFAWLAAHAPARAQATIDVDLELILAIDASLSIDAEEAQLQRQGYVAALTDPRVVKAIQSGANGKIAVFYFEWASEFYQRVIVDWTLIQDEASARAVADTIAASPYRGERRTSISGAIQYAAGQFGKRYHGERRVIDVSGDGRNNSGPSMEPTRAEVLAKGITINGLPILNDKPSFGGFGGGYGYGPDPYLDRYYQESVIGGPGAFMIPAENFQSFDQAILSKLIREISAAPTGDRTLAASELRR